MSTRTAYQQLALAIASAAFVFIAQNSFAQTTMPSVKDMPPAMATTMPSSAPSVAVDTKTPRGTLKMLMTAMQGGDDKTLRSLMVVNSPVQQKMVDAMAKRSVIEARFRAAALKAFGEDKSKLLAGDTKAAMADGMQKVDEAKESIDGDNATVTSEGGAPPLSLKRVDGEWKIPADELAKGVDPKALDQQLDDMMFQATSMDAFSGDLETGKFKTVEEAGQALRQQMMMDMMKRNAAASQPTSQPSMQDSATTKPQ